MKKEPKYNWNMVFILTLLPFIGLFGTGIYIYFNGIVWQEPLIMLVLWFLSGLAITMGYHRLFAHKSYETNNFIEWTLMIFGSIAFENTILKWCSDHRKHHNNADTEHDPYSITEGFWHAHIGWILKNTPEEKNKIQGVKDLEKKSAIKFQNKYYIYIGVIVGMLIPLAIGFLYGRPIGAVLWGTFLRITLVHHGTFFINSLCHYVGDRPYDINSSARDSWFVSLFTFGEGYHNYHHKFQWDYRNGIKWFAYDPGKWLIKTLSIFGITYNLKQAKDLTIWQSKIESLKIDLADKITQSNKLCKEFYNHTILLLDKKTEEMLLKWNQLEVSYSKNIGQIKDKSDIKNINKERKKYKKQLYEISCHLNNLINHIKRNQLSEKLVLQ